MLNFKLNSSIPKYKTFNFNSSKKTDKYDNVLIPRNVYLATNRIFTQEEADKIIEDFGEPFWKKAMNFVKRKIKKLQKS